MPAFRYTATSAEGGIRQGVIEALSKAQAVSSLQERGLMLMDICEERRPVAAPPAAAVEKPEPVARPAVKALPQTFPKATWSRFERAVFLRQLALMFASGVSLFRAIEVLSTQARRPALSACLVQIVKSMEGGVTLSVTLDRSRLFTPLQVGTVRIGEATGQLGSLLESLAQVEEQEVAFSRKLMARLSYPVGVLLAVLVGLSLLGHVMGGAMTTLVTSLPGSASVAWLLLLGKALASPWFIVFSLGIPLGSLALLRFLWEREPSREALEQVLLRVQPFGPLWRRMQAARLCRLLALMITSGVRADRTLDLIAQSTGSPAARRALGVCRETLQEGEGLATALRRSAFFPAEVVHMAAAGEESGRLGVLLERVADYCEIEVERFLESACAALEPLAMMVLGFGVGVVILVTFAPVYQLLDKL